MISHWTRILSVFYRRGFYPGTPTFPRAPLTEDPRGEESVTAGPRAADSQARKGRSSPVWCWRPVRPLNADAAAFIKDRWKKAGFDVLSFQIRRRLAHDSRPYGPWEARPDTAASFRTCGSPAPDRPRVMGNTPAARRGNEMESGECFDGRAWFCLVIVLIDTTNAIEGFIRPLVMLSWRSEGRTMCWCSNNESAWFEGLVCVCDAPCVCVWRI